MREQRPTTMKNRSLILFACIAFVTATAFGSTLTFSGSITQSVPDGTGPAQNNTSLNNIADTEAYSVALLFAGDITTTGTYTLLSGLFQVPSAPAAESDFASLQLTITANGANDEFSLLGCLNSGSGCALGNELTANFSIPAALIGGSSVAATGLDQPHPLDLLEDDGGTDIHGTITQYSYQGTSATPEPASATLFAAAAAVLAVCRMRFGASRRSQPQKR